MKKLVCFWLAGLLLTPLCAGGKADADFFAAQKNYPESEYISAIGNGADRAAAESNAKLALSQILGESISAEQVTTYYADAKGREEGTIASVVNEKAVFAHITGIVIKEHYQDKKTGMHYALAVLNRKETGNYYFSQVNDANAQVAALLEKARANRGKLASLDYARSAGEIATDNEYDMNLLSVINPTQARLARVSYESPQAVRAQTAELSAALRVWIRIAEDNTDSDVPKRLYAAFSALLTERGVTVVGADDSMATHGITADITFSPAESPDPAYRFVRYALSAVLTEFATNKEVPYAVSGREGHVTESQAKNRAVLKLEEAIKTQFPL